MFEWITGTTSKDVTLEWKSYDDDEKFDIQIKKVTWKKGMAGDFEMNLYNMYTNGIKQLRYAGINYIENGKVGDLQLL